MKRQNIKHKKPLRAFGYFANLNKNNTIDEYEEEVLKGEYRKEEVLIVKTIKVDYISYVGLQNTFLFSVGIWDEIGGSDIKPEAEKENKELWDEIQNIKRFWELSEEAREFWKDNSITNVIEVVLEGKAAYGNDKRFFVDTEGFGYARYVGLSKERFDWLFFQKEKQELQEKDLEFEVYFKKLGELEKKYGMEDKK